MAGIVVLYEPDENVIENIKSYINELAKLYIIDNSKKIHSDIIEKIGNGDKLEYSWLGDNKGIAKALNIGLALAKKNGFRYVLTMDQDSKFDADVILKYFKTAEILFSKHERLICCGPNHFGVENEIENNKCIEIVDEIITSGMIIDIEKTNQVGTFLEKLFIDYVDYEFCYRAKKNRYYCMLINECMLTHQVGGMSPVKMYGITFKRHNEHNKIRVYYLVRNAIYTMVQYPFSICRISRWTVKTILKIIIVDTDKLNKLLYGLYGIYDFIRGKYGKCSYYG